MLIGKSFACYIPREVEVKRWAKAALACFLLYTAASIGGGALVPFLESFGLLIFIPIVLAALLAALEHLFFPALPARHSAFLYQHAPGGKCNYYLGFFGGVRIPGMLSRGRSAAAAFGVVSRVDTSEEVTPDAPKPFLIKGFEFEAGRVACAANRSLWRLPYSPCSCFGS